MIHRELFDNSEPLAAKPKRPGSKTPELPPVVNAPCERWRITVEPTGNGPPTIIRVRRTLKTALRAHGLRAVAIESLPPVATPGESSACQSSEAPNGPVRAFNQAVERNKP